MNEKRLVAEIDGQLKELVKADPRTIKEIVESSLQREFQTADDAAIRRRIDEQQQRITTLEREINDREAELSKARDELQRLQSVLERKSSKEDMKIEKAKESLSETPNDPENPAVQNWAKKCGMSPEELLAEIEATQ